MNLALYCSYSIYEIWRRKEDKTIKQRDVYKEKYISVNE